MKRITIYITRIILLSLLLFSNACISNNSDSNNDSFDDETNSSSLNYDDLDTESPEENNSNNYSYNGTYCAEVSYYNPRTGTSSVYTLEVEVENDILTTLHWPNGGWLDDSHFNGEDISDGNCSFTDDRAVDFEVTLLDGDCSTSSYIEDDTEDFSEEE